MPTVTVTHMAGPYVAIEGRVLQRCLICGEKLADTFITNGKIPSPKNLPGIWEPYCYVRFTTNGDNMVTKEIVVIGMDMSLPDDWCLLLVEM